MGKAWRCCRGDPQMLPRCKGGRRYFGVRKARRRGQLEGMVVMSRGEKDSH